MQFNPSEDTRALASILKSEWTERMSYPLGSMDAHLQKLTEKLSEIRGGTDVVKETSVEQKRNAEQSTVKPKTLAGKLSAAKEKAKIQDSPSSKPAKRDERE